MTAEAERPTTAELVAAGLHDPNADDAGERLELLDYLLDQGCTLDDLVRADTNDRLVAAASDRLLGRGQPRLDRAAVAALADVDVDVAMVASAWRALGFPEPPDNAEIWWPSDADTFAAFAGAAELFGQDRLSQFSRVLGRAAALVAEAAVAMFMSGIRGPLEQNDLPPLELARANVAGQIAADAVPGVFEAAFRHHFQATGRRVDDTTFTPGHERAVLCVGFADLVGSTELAHRLDPAGTARLAVDLDRAATDAVAARDGRLVKTIGDGVLFTTTRTGGAIAIARDLLAWADDDAQLEGLRIGLSTGPVVWQDGDVHGPVVNLAARLCDAATGSQILVDDGFATAHGPDGSPALVPAGTLTLRGFGTPVDAFTPAGGDLADA